MKAILDESGVITIYPETVSEKIVIQYMNEESVSDNIVVLSEQIFKQSEEE